MKTFRIILTAILFLLIINGCNTEKQPKANDEYVAEINQWHNKRIENLKKENGWLNLVGLYWLDEGENSIGSGNENNIVFPKNAPKSIGVISLKDSIINFKVNPKVEVFKDSVKIDEIKLKPDISGEPTILEHGSFRWYIIKRGERYGIRLRDLDAPLVKNFNGIERYPVDESWKVTAEYEPYNPPKVISVPTILGTIDEEKSPGKLVFTIDEKTYSLDVIDSGNKFFIIFGDETNGEETYGAGRFLYTDKPDSTGKVILDFNKSYNPPCVFTKYATCPLPPKQNLLHLEISAGEKMYGDMH